MSTTDTSMAENTDEECSRHSESEMSTIGDVVVWHQMPFFPVHRLVQLHCPRWPMWESSNVARIAKARMLDNTRDWYFPIIIKRPSEKVVTERLFTFPPLWGITPQTELYMRGFPSLPVRIEWASWSGIWHANAQHASAKARRLPPVTHFPEEWLQVCNPHDDIITSAGGLLLIKDTLSMFPIHRRQRLSHVLHDPNPSSTLNGTDLTTGTSNAWRISRLPQLWQRLLVCNPLMRKWRELPALDCGLLGFDSWQTAYQSGVHAQLVVDEEANCYQVILTFDDFMVVYASTTNSWKCLRFPERHPWGRCHFYPRQLSFVRWEHMCASAHAGGRLYFADLEPAGAFYINVEPIVKATPAATLRLFEVDAEVGRWGEVQHFMLSKFHIPSLRHFSTIYYDLDLIPFFEILECSGGLYAVLPAQVHDAWLIGEPVQRHDWMSDTLRTVDESGNILAFMPLCFYIMQLRGQATDCGVLRIQISVTRPDFHTRFGSLFTMANEEGYFPHWFSCEARGSVIWVAFKDYLLSFDLVSREAKTQIIPLDNGAIHPFGEETLRFAYRPSLHMKP